jgi:aspartate dehydrogenase
MKVGIVGCGTIGSAVAKAMEKLPEVEETLLFDRKASAVKGIKAILTKGTVCSEIDELIFKSELVVEAASQDAAREVIPKALTMCRSIVIMSVGALVDEPFWKEMKALAKKNKCKIFLPSGAICGIDGLCAAGQGDLHHVEMITVKNPAALKGTKYLEDKGIDLDAISKPTVLYKGPATEAVKLFPKNLNVAASVSLVGLGFDRTMVTIIADPSATENIHKIVATGDFGKFTVEMANMPSPKNPRTSYIAVLSAVSAVKKIVGSVWYGA